MIACCLVPSAAHTNPHHPENPQRFAELGRLREAPFSGQIEWLSATPAGEEALARVHSPAMLDRLRRAAARGPAILDEAPTYVTPASWEAALSAAGGTLACLRAVLAGDAQAGFALVRPPGHHAGRSHSMGFCLLNNLAIAAAEALHSGVARILIVDFDAHHGNGTQEIFAAEPRVACVSLHQTDLYPTGSGGLYALPRAAGRIVNLPLPAYSGDAAFNLAAEQVIRPLARRFRPELLLVSAGFDAHWADPLTDLGVSAAGFYTFARSLVSLAGETCAGKCLFVLEGGYQPRALADSVLACLAALCGVDLPEEIRDASPYPEPDVSALIRRVREFHHLE